MNGNETPSLECNERIQNEPRRQKYLGDMGLIALITFLSAFVPLSTDLYLPTLPGMALYFDVSADLVNLTLILFLVFFAIGMLFWGPLSDKYGRRPVLLIGLSVYTAASFACAGSWDIYHLIAFRILQAIGGSAAFAVATAMIKDVYDRKRREPILAMVQSMVLIAPAAAPVLGALLLKFMSWRGEFLALAFIGLLALAGSIALQETIDKRNTGSILQTLGGLYTVARNPGFSSLLGLFSLPMVSAMAFIASSSYIYINGFGLSAQVYSYYFAINAIGMIFGPILYMRVSRRYTRRSIILACFAIISASGLLISLVGGFQPWMLAIVLLPATICGSGVRVPGANLMLEQQREDTGSAAALLNCFATFLGSIGMTIISLNWSNTILVLGMMNILVGLAGVMLWMRISQKPYVMQVPERYIAAASR
ncbi:MAG: multidrug effflux MFS transporter [Methanothrix sp.]|jgi:DHA1 family bicyclomycin/chloramphenicol resistance-like MFS transporter|nr:multidrug effflux MFS transporter [Methanothrix sp.]